MLSLLVGNNNPFATTNSWCYSFTGRKPTALFLCSRVKHRDPQGCAGQIDVLSHNSKKVYGDAGARVCRV